MDSSEDHFLWNVCEYARYQLQSVSYYCCKDLTAWVLDDFTCNISFDDVMMTMTLFVLFGSSIRLLAADKGADEVFDVLYSLCFVSFILEFLLMSWSKSAVTFPDALPPRLLPPEPLDTASEDGESTKSNKSDSNYQQRGTEMPSSIDTVARRPRPASLREQPLEQLLETRMTRASSTGSMATNGMNYNKLTIFRSSSFLGIPAEFSGNEEQDGRSESTYEPPVSFFGRISSCVDGVHLFIMKRWPAVWYYSCCCSWLLCGSIYRLCGYANNIQVEGYLLSFYWYLDLLSIVSLFPDVSWVARGLGLQVDRDSVGTEVDVVYAGRVFRLVRLVRVVRLFKVIAERWRKYAHTKRLAKLVSEGKMCVEEAEAQAYIHDNRQSKLGARLSTTITQKVFLMILILAVVLPFLFYNHGDDSATYAIETLHLYNTNTSLNNATKLAAVSSIVNSTQRSDNMFSYILRLEVTPLVDGYVVNYQDKIDDTRTLALTEITRRSFDSNGQEYVTSGVFTNALYIYIEALNTILLIISVAIVMICGAVFFTSDVERLVLKPIERMMAIVEVVASDPLSPLIFQTDNGENGHSTKQRRKSSITSSRRTKSPKNSIDGYRSRGGWKGSNRSLDGSSQSDNYSEYSNYGDHSDDSGADDDSDLYESGEDSSPEIDPRRTRRNRNSNHRSWRYSYRKSRRLSKEYSRLSLLSNENPRHASSKGHLLKTKLSSRKLELYASNTGATYETRLLESTIQKITGLLRVGFGEAGAGIISNNLRSTYSTSTVIDPLLSGTRVYAIMGFCDIHRFEEVTQKLSRDVMTFVNTLAEIVHDSVHSWGGQCNKNLGNAFVLIWRIGDEESLILANKANIANRRAVTQPGAAAGEPGLGGAMGATTSTRNIRSTLTGSENLGLNNGTNSVHGTNFKNNTPRHANHIQQVSPRTSQLLQQSPSNKYYAARSEVLKSIHSPSSKNKLRHVESPHSTKSSPIASNGVSTKTLAPLDTAGTSLKSSDNVTEEPLNLSPRTILSNIMNHNYFVNLAARSVKSTPIIGDVDKLSDKLVLDISLAVPSEAAVSAASRSGVPLDGSIKIHNSPSTTPRSLPALRDQSDLKLKISDNKQASRKISEVDYSFRNLPSAPSSPKNYFKVSPSSPLKAFSVDSSTKSSIQEETDAWETSSVKTDMSSRPPPIALQVHNKVDLRKVPGIEAIADGALIGFLKVIAEINRATDVLAYRNEKRLTTITAMIRRQSTVGIPALVAIAEDSFSQKSSLNEDCADLPNVIPEVTKNDNKTIFRDQYAINPPESNGVSNKNRSTLGASIFSMLFSGFSSPSPSEVVEQEEETSLLGATARDVEEVTKLEIQNEIDEPANRIKSTLSDRFDHEKEALEFTDTERPDRGTESEVDVDTHNSSCSASTVLVADTNNTSKNLQGSIMGDYINSNSDENSVALDRFSSGRIVETKDIVVETEASRTISRESTTIPRRSLAKPHVRRLSGSKTGLSYRERELYQHTYKEFKVRMGFGLHAGWAIEGAVGSIYKVDATYLSPHVNLAARLETASRQFGVPLLASHYFHELLSQTAQERCRKLDCVTVKGSELPITIYTYDCYQDQIFLPHEKFAENIHDETFDGNANPLAPKSDRNTNSSSSLVDTTDRNNNKAKNADQNSARDDQGQSIKAVRTEPTSALGEFAEIDKSTNKESNHDQIRQQPQLASLSIRPTKNLENRNEEEKNDTSDHESKLQAAEDLVTRAIKDPDHSAKISENSSLVEESTKTKKVRTFKTGTISPTRQMRYLDADELLESPQSFFASSSEQSNRVLPSEGSIRDYRLKKIGKYVTGDENVELPPLPYATSSPASRLHKKTLERTELQNRFRNPSPRQPYNSKASESVANTKTVEMTDPPESVVLTRRRAASAFEAEDINQTKQVLAMKTRSATPTSRRNSMASPQRIRTTISYDKGAVGALVVDDRATALAALASRRENKTHNAHQTAPKESQGAERKGSFHTSHDTKRDRRSTRITNIGSKNGHTVGISGNSGDSKSTNVNDSTIGSIPSNSTGGNSFDTFAESVMSYFFNSWPTAENSLPRTSHDPAASSAVAVQPAVELPLKQFPAMSDTVPKEATSALEESLKSRGLGSNVPGDRVSIASATTTVSTNSADHSCEKEKKDGMGSRGRAGIRTYSRNRRGLVPTDLLFKYELTDEDYALARSAIAQHYPDAIRCNPTDEDTEEVFLQDIDLLQLRGHVNEFFMSTFNKGIDFYLKGDWQRAKVMLHQSDRIMAVCIQEMINGPLNSIRKPPAHLNLANPEDEINGPTLGDVPSQTVLKYMKKYNYKAPVDWKGYRPLTSK